jgi:hypothetical protein
MKKLSLAGLALAAIVGTGCGQQNYTEEDLGQLGLETEATNGISSNGVSYNGFRLNGFRLNGFRLNGFRLNGIFLGGLLAAETEDSLVQFDSAALGSGTDIEGVVEDDSVALMRITSTTWDSSIQNYLYVVKSWDGDSWEPACGLDSGGQPVKAIAMSDRWDLINGNRVFDSTKFTFACTNAALGKCVMWGYPRWLNKQECKSGSGCKNQALAYWHEACQYMVRADYCGNGLSHTKNGTTIDVYDPLGIQDRANVAGFSMEAEWRHDGAHCISHTRWTKASDNHPYSTDLAYIQATCPSRLKANNPGECSNEATSNYYTNNGYSTSLELRKPLRNDSVMQ